VRTFFGKGQGFFRCGSPRFFVQKLLDFSKFMVCPHGQEKEGLSQRGHFADKGEGGQFFAILCGRLLWTAPKTKNTLFFRKKNCKNDPTLGERPIDTSTLLPHSVIIIFNYYEKTTRVKIITHSKYFAFYFLRALVRTTLKFC